MASGNVHIKQLPTDVVPRTIAPGQVAEKPPVTRPGTEDDSSFSKQTISKGDSLKNIHCSPPPGTIHIPNGGPNVENIPPISFIPPASFMPPASFREPSSIRNTNAAKIALNTSVKDVHAFTKDLKKELLSEYPELIKRSREVLEGNMLGGNILKENGEKEMNSRIAIVREHVKQIGSAAENAISKIVGRISVQDNDLDGVYPAGLFIIIVNMIEKYAVHEEDKKSAYTNLIESLAETGMTCVQGDTHRLFSIFVALHRSFIDPEYQNNRK